LTRAEALAQVIEALAQEQFSWKRGSEPPAFEGNVTILGRTLRLGITFPRLDFTILPRVRLLNRAAELPGHRAHVEDDDAVCYSSPGTLVLDMYEPGRHALTVLGLVKRTITQILSGEAEQDLAIEFPQHWRGALPLHVALPPDAPAGSAKFVKLERLGSVDALVLARAGAEDGTLDLGAFGIFSGKGLSAYLATTDAQLRLQPGEAMPANLAEFLAWAERVDPTLPETLKRALVVAGGAAMLLVRGPNGCVGVLPLAPETWAPTRRDPNLMARMLRAHPERVGVIRLRGNPADTPHVMGRNLVGAPTLAGRRIVLVGCGTIGSHLAKFLAQSGAGYGGGRLDLVDAEILLPANLGRHWLPSRRVACSKALACAAEILDTFPSSRIEAHNTNLTSALDLLDGADLIIDSTGEQPLSSLLNDLIVRRRSGGPALLLVWLRGMGAAAQALFVPAVEDGRGCHRCLRPDPETWAAGRVMPESTVLIEAPAACGEAAFLPYGVAGPAIAAGLATRMALEWAAGDVRPSLRTLRVDLTATLPVEDIDLAADPCCPACSAGRFAPPLRLP
jgi:molybdopterin/thiamine biosynthesis adenylyltransferase